MAGKRYIEWNYDIMEATEYERMGECNQCGECCLSRIAFRVAFQDARVMADAKVDRRNGGDTIKENGIWNEVEIDKQRSFFQFTVQLLDGTHCCRLVGSDEIMQQVVLPTANSFCTIYEERPLIYSEWPFSPNNVAHFPSCSYTLEEIQTWQIEED